MSQASWSSPTSQSSLTSRSSETTRARSSSRDVVGGHHAVDVGRDAAEHPGLAGAVGGQGVLELVDVAALDAERVGDLVQRRAAPDPQLAVLPVAEELVGVARRARPRVEHRLAVLDDQHGVAGLVAGEVGVGGVGAEPVVGVVGAHLERAGRQHQPLAGEHRGQLRAAPAARSATGWRRQVELAVAPAGPHEGGVGLGDGGVVGLDVQLLGRGLRVVLARTRWWTRSWFSLAHARHCTPERGCRRPRHRTTPRHGRTRVVTAGRSPSS